MTTGILPPPDETGGAIAWLRRNLFATWYDTLLTVVLVVVLGAFAIGAAQWAVTEARWGVVITNLRLFLIGQYPFEEAWRIWLGLTILSALAGLSAGIYGGAVRTLGTWLAAGQAILAGLAFVSALGPIVALALVFNSAVAALGFILGLRRSAWRNGLAVGWLVSLPVVFLLLSGISGTVIPEVGTNVWGGLLLTFVLATVGIVLAFPLGVLLALGRRSALPAIRVLSTAYIELIRGVPLVTILFMADLILPLFLPGDVRIDRVIRATGGIVLFSAAYVAENVRGGLQAIPTGQVEAAQALGLNAFQSNLFVVLPQALRAVIPANVGLFISLLKDTTLVVIIGLLELLGIGRAVLAQPQWLGAQLEVYVFIAIVFFVLCYTLSQASYRLEASLGVGSR